MCDILKPKNFDPSLLEFSEVKTNKYGGKAVYVKYNGGRLQIQTPKMTLPYGLNEDELTDPKTNEVIGHKYSVNLSFRDMDRENDESLPSSSRNNARRLRECHEMFNSVDDQVVKEGANNSMPWLKMKNAQEQVVKALFNDTIKVSRDKVSQEPDGKWPDTVRCKIPYFDGAFKVEVYSDNREQVDLREYIVKRAETVSLLECTGIWFAGSKFGVGWKLVQMQVLNRPAGVTGYSFLPDSDAEDEDSDADEVRVVPANQAVVDASSSNDDGSGDGLDDGVESSDEEPQPPVNKKKPKR